MNHGKGKKEKEMIAAKVKGKNGWYYWLGTTEELIRADIAMWMSCEIKTFEKIDIEELSKFFPPEDVARAFAAIENAEKNPAARYGYGLNYVFSLGLAPTESIAEAA